MLYEVITDRIEGALPQAPVTSGNHDARLSDQRHGSAGGSERHRRLRERRAASVQPMSQSVQRVFHQEGAMIEIEPMFKGIAQIPALLMAMDDGVCDG